MSDIPSARSKSAHTAASSSPPARRKLGRGLGSLLAGAGRTEREPRSPLTPDAAATPGIPATAVTAATPVDASQHEHATADERASTVEKPTSGGAIPIEPAHSAATKSVGIGGDAPGSHGTHRVDDLPIDRIEPNSKQPRQRFDDVSLAGLTESIRVAGVMQPVIVRPLPDGQRFELVAGERRWRAAARLGLQTIPAIVRTLDDREAAEWALIENLQREDLNPMDRAVAFRRLVEEFGLTHAQLAERLGVDRSSITNILRLNELDAETAEAVRGGQLGLGHAKALLGCPSVAIRRALAEQTIRHGWSVRRTERAVATATRPSTNAAASREASPASLHRADLERRLGEWLGTRVTLQRGGGERPGRLAVEFYSIDQFEGILQRIGVPDDVLRA